LGIPLNLRNKPGEVAAPVPVRTSHGRVLLPSPTVRLDNRPQPPEIASAQSAAPTLVSFGPRPGQDPGAAGVAPVSMTIRAMATPLMRNRRPGGC